MTSWGTLGLLLSQLLAPDCFPGFCAEEGFWANWCVDECRNFRETSAYGIMGSNADGSRRVGEFPQGFFEFTVRTMTDRWPTGGGTHLAGPMSGAPHFEGLDAYSSWLKPDIATKPCGFRVDTYNYDEKGNPWYRRPDGELDPVVDVWCPGIMLPPPGEWRRLRLEWMRISPEWIWYRFEGQVRMVRIHPLSRNPAYVSFGNMDALQNYGGIPEIHFTQVKWGELVSSDPVEPTTWGRIKGVYR